MSGLPLCQFPGQKRVRIAARKAARRQPGIHFACSMSGRPKAPQAFRLVSSSPALCASSARPFGDESVHLCVRRLFRFQQRGRVSAVLTPMDFRLHRATWNSPMYASSNSGPWAISARAIDGAAVSVSRLRVSPSEGASAAW